MKQALIIFVRKPEFGKVKTRLAATVGNEKALEIYKTLLQHTHTVAEQVKADKFVFYHQQTEENDIWSKDGFTKKLQSDADLGKKMSDAFSEVFNAGFGQAVIIGSDCLQLQAQVIEDAFAILRYKDLVIGPANDGGYYLLGMKKMHEFIFRNKDWSTDSVLKQTFEDIARHQLSVGLLPQLIDVDTEEDWLLSKPIVS